MGRYIWSKENGSTEELNVFVWRGKRVWHPSGYEVRALVAMDTKGQFYGGIREGVRADAGSNLSVDREWVDISFETKPYATKEGAAERANGIVAENIASGIRDYIRDRKFISGWAAEEFFKRMDNPKTGARPERGPDVKHSQGPDR